MQVICSQAELATALRALSRMTKKELFPLYHSVLLTATYPATDSAQGVLTLLGIGMYGMVGMVMHLPATVDQEGQVLVSIEPLTEYVAGLRPGNLTLGYERAEPSAEEEQALSPLSQVLHAPTTLFPLQITSTYSSPARTASTNQANVATWKDWEQYPQPPIQQWLTARVPMAVLEVASLKEAIAHCAPLANKGRRWKGEATEMDGILLRLNTDSIEFFAATGMMLISHCLPLHHPASFSFTGLFPGKALSWMKESLSDGEVTLALARDEHTHKDVLLFSTAQMTCFCRSVDAPLPSTWTSILNMPHEAEVLIRRRELMNPLKFFAGSVSTLSQALSLEMEGTMLKMSIVASDNAVQQHRTISLLHSSRELNMLVDPKQFKELVYYAGGDQLRLQVGHFERQRGQRRKRIGFLRITSKQTTVMMSLSRRELTPSLPTAPPIHGTVSAEIDTEPVFASQEA